MKPIEIVELIKKSNPALLGKLPDVKAASIIRVALNHISRQVTAVNAGVVKVQGLGNFNVRQVQREKDGKKKTVRVTLFRAIEPKAK